MSQKKSIELVKDIKFSLISPPRSLKPKIKNIEKTELFEEEPLP